MSIRLKYGLMITTVVVVWVSITRILFSLPRESKANLLAPILFNLTAIVAIYLGIKARKNELGGGLSFKEGVKTGVSISLVYALSASVFFFIMFLVVGPELIASEPMSATYPIWQVMLFAYLGLFFFALVSGLIYSTIISFVLAKRRSEGD